MKPNAEVLEDIFAELISVYENLKAEIVIAEIQEKSEITVDDFVIANKSTFSRPFRRDIISVDNLLNENMLTLNLSRNGLYDTLPEGLFHTQTSTKDTTSYIARRKTLKQEEDDARSFFAPIENEFFYQRLAIECNERELLDNFYNLNDDFLIDFWNIGADIPEEYTLKLIKLLPHSYKIAGNFELTRLTLEKIIGEEVTFKKTYKNKIDSEIHIEKKARQKELQLGVDTVLNSSKKEVYSPTLEVTIGPISEKNINNYLKKDGVLKFINTFYDYFVPFEIEVITKFITANENGFVIDGTNSSIMGISTQL